MIADSLRTMDFNPAPLSDFNGSVVCEDWASYCYISNTVVEGARLSYNGLWMIFQCLSPEVMIF